MYINALTKIKIKGRINIFYKNVYNRAIRTTTWLEIIDYKQTTPTQAELAVGTVFASYGEILSQG